jgi:DNA-binding transcriptional MocR family regulator
MHLASPWTPRLAAEGRPSERLVAAIAEDIADGALARGDRLPPHRELAYRLGIGLGTVTKAYAVLERRGLVRSVRGRGMFVSGLAPRPDGVIDLGVNMPPQVLDDRLLAATLTRLARRLDAGTFGAFTPAAGRADHRALAAGWLAGQRMEVAADCLLLCNGAQHALSVAFATACRPGGALLTEAATFPGALMLARESGLRPVGLALDGEGILPEALEAALRSPAMAGAAPVLYVTPTLNNPTAATMGAARRRDIVRLCRQHEATIVEDDVYSLFAGPDLPPLAALAPERTLYVSGLSKSVSPGLRMGMLAVPRPLAERALARLQATSTMASALSSAIMAEWLTDGTAHSVAASIRLDTARRHEILQGFPQIDRLAADPGSQKGAPKGFHVWLPMPTDAAERLASEAAAMGVILMPPRQPLVDPAAPDSGLRLSLGTPPIDKLKEALALLAALLAGPVDCPA